MPREDLWSTDDPERLLKLARTILENGAWKGFLNKDEYKLFQSAVQQGGRVWDHFITGKAVVQVDRYHIAQSAPTNVAISTIGKQDKSRSQSINGTNGVIRPSQIRNEITPDNESVLHDEASDIQAQSPFSRAGSLQPNQKPKEELISVTLDCASVSFRIRYMLYEKALPVLFPDLHNDLDLDSIIDQDKPNDQNQFNNKIVSGTTVRQIEDDYDDEEDEEDEKTDINMEKNNDTSSTDVDMEEINEAEKPVVIKVSVHDNDDEDNDEKTKAKEVVISNYNKMYHIFEHDRENAMRQRRLEESDRQVDSDILDENTPNSGSTRKAPSGASFGAANLSLKHLLATIETKRDSLSMSDSELKNLIFDVRKNRSKWASEEKIGQEELYEAAEKVVLELRGYTEHSTAFLNKVSKRDAPNYFNVIKHPMDLNTVMKKLKSLQYKSKKEFVSDLMLIWKNCLTYNTDPRHFLRAHAIAMQKKTLSLIPLIPDITIRDRAEVEAEEARAAQEDGEEDADNGVSAKRSVMGKSSKKHAAKGRKRKLDDLNESEKPAMEENQDTSMQNSHGTPALANPTLANIAASGTPRGSPTPATPHSPSTGVEYDMESALIDTDEVSEDTEQHKTSTDFETSVWQELFTKRRAEYCCKRGDLFRKNQLQKDAEAIIRKSMAMGRFYDLISHSFHPLDEFGRLKRERFFQSRDLLEALDSEKRQFILEYEVGAGLPADPPMAHDAFEVFGEEAASTNINLKNQKYQSEMDRVTEVGPSNYITHGGITKDYDNNLQTIQEIRKICSKLSLVRQMQQQQFMHAIQPYEPEKIVEKDLDIESRLPDRDQYDGPASLQAIRRSVSKIAMHNGFEVTELMAVDALAEIASDYLSNLGKLLVLTFESPNSSSMSTEEKVMLTLQERGIESLSSLDLFVREDIQRYSNRLQDLKKNLTSFLTDLLRPSVQDITDNQFADGSDQFLNGDFSQQLGDDFFGFKELGLDKELGVLGAAVPFHLLQSRLSSNLNSQSNLPVNKGFETQIPDYPPINRARAKREIGLLRSFFVSRLDIPSLTTEVPKSDGEGTEVVLLESDKLPPKQRNVRPKIPPTGKIVGVKKKPLSKCFFLSSEKKDKENKNEDEKFLENLESSINAFEDNNGIDKSVDSLF